MKTLLPYIAFPGTCEEALTFYAKVFQGEIVSITTYSNSPVTVAESLKSRIFDSEFRAENLHFKASDDLPDFPITQGSNISMFVKFTSQNERRQTFEALSEGGQVLFPYDEHFCMLKDKFGLQWMLVPQNE